MPSVTKRNMSLMLFTIFLTTLLVIKAQLYRKTDSCPSGIVQWRKQEDVFQCPPETPYHCILMYNSKQLYETCIAAVTIGPGKVGCPWILLHQGKPIHGSKNSECPVTNPECPPTNHKGYLSNQLYQYQACFLESSERTSQLKPSTLAEANIPDPNLTSKESTVEVWSIIVPVISIVLIIVAAAVVVVLLRRNKVICRSNQGLGRTKRDENKGSTKTLEDIKPIPGEGHGNIDDSAEKVQLIPTTTAHDNRQSGNQQSQLPGSGERDEVPYKTVQNETLTRLSTDDKNLADTQRKEVYDVNLAQRVFRDILVISDGVVSYQKLLMHFVNKDNCPDILGNLENILKGNRNVFRYLEDGSICFVIAYIPDADICENYNNSSSLAGECVDPICSKFHICTLYVNGMCKKHNCTLFHTYGNPHNVKVKDLLSLSGYSDIAINKILLNRYPKICSSPGCDTEEDCPYLHICSKFCFENCSHGLECRFGHEFKTEHNVWILKAYGISEDEISSGSPIARKLTIAKRRDTKT